MTTPTLPLPPAETDLDETATPTLDPEMTVADLWAQLLAESAEATHYRNLYGGLGVKYGRLANAAGKVVRGEMKLEALAAVLQELGR